MASLKLNMITVWNDYVPVNAAEFVRYAHEKEIKVIWGYSWGWGEVSLDISDEIILKKWTDAAVRTYETQYAGLGGDGIYFQLFTETFERLQNGVVIAKAAARWVNTISAELLSRHPGMTIQFGLHASSVKDDLDFIKEVDPHVTIVWEDCGSFPYHYIPQKTGDFEETLAFTKTISGLRGDGEKFGAVLKGLSCLNWDIFEHQKGNFIMGANLSAGIKDAKLKAAIWRYIQAYWIRNSDKAYETIKVIHEKTQGRTAISALVDDGLFEDKIWYPAALFAAMTWDVNMNIKDLACEVALNPNISFI
jgi:hypothetical protein